MECVGSLAVIQAQDLLTYLELFRSEDCSCVSEWQYCSLK